MDELSRPVSSPGLGLHPQATTKHLPLGALRLAPPSQTRSGWPACRTQLVLSSTTGCWEANHHWSRFAPGWSDGCWSGLLPACREWRDPQISSRHVASNQNIVQWCSSPRRTTPATNCHGASLAKSSMNSFAQDCQNRWWWTCHWPMPLSSSPVVHTGHCSPRKPHRKSHPSPRHFHWPGCRDKSKMSVGSCWPMATNYCF